jgi:hypothetical protein
VIYSVARRLFHANRDRRAVRLVGVTMDGLEKPHGVEQSPLFERDRRARSLVRRIDQVRDLYGERAILRAAALR